MPTPTQLIYRDNPGGLPAEYRLPSDANLVVSSIVARYSGAGASAAFLACLSIYDQAGNLMARARADQVFAAGDTGVVTFAPFLRRSRSSGPIIGEEIAYAQITSNLTITSTSEAAPDDVVGLAATAYNGIDRVEIVFFSASNVIPVVGLGSAGFLVCNLWDGSTDLGRIAVMQKPVSSGAEFAFPIQVSHRLTPSAGSHTYKIRAWHEPAQPDCRIDAAVPRLPAYLRALRVA